MPLVWTLVLVACSALLCAALAFRLGQPLVEERDASDLAEQFQRHRVRIFGLVFAALLFLPLGLAAVRGDLDTFRAAVLPWLLVAAGLSTLGVMAGDFPLRRALFDDRTSFPQHVIFTLRTLVGLAGFWILLLGGPYFVSLGHAAAWWVGAALVLVLVGWALRFAWCTQTLLGARVLDDPALVGALEEVSARAHCSAPVVLAFGDPAGSFFNAFALPHPTQPRVVFSRPLLAALAREEVAAIFAHELCHLEEHTPALLRKRAFFQYPAIFVSGLGLPILQAFAPELAAWFPLAWLVSWLLVGLTRVQRTRAHETESDLRAVELCGDAGALARALISIHAANGLPRRLRADAERMSTHPSLARRLQALYAATGDPEVLAAAVAEPLGSDDGEAVVAMHARDTHRGVRIDVEGVSWWRRESGAAEHADCDVYADIVALQIEYGLRGPRLCLETRRGQTRLLPLRREDVPAIQRALDRVDLKLAGLGAHPWTGQAWAVLLGFLASVVAFPLADLGALSAGWAVLFLCMGLTVLVARDRSTLGALGAMVLSAGAYLAIFGDDLAGRSTAGWALLGIWFVLGAGCLGLALRAARLPEVSGLRRGRPWLTASLGFTLALPGLLAAVAAATGERPGLDLYAVQRTNPLLVLGLVGAGAVLVMAEARGVRVAGRVLVACGVLPFLFGTGPFLERFGHDPFVAAVESPVWASRELPTVWSLDIDTNVSDLRVQSDGARVVALVRRAPEGPASWQFFDASGPGVSILAYDVALRAGQPALILAEEPNGLVVRENTSKTDAWRVVLAERQPSEWVNLRVEGARWLVTRSDRGRGASVVVGTVGAAGFTERVFETSLSSGVRWMTDANHAVEIEWVHGHRGARASWQRVLWALTPSFDQADVRLAGAGETIELGRTALSASCEVAGVSADTALCFMSDQRRGWLWRVDLASGEAHPWLEVDWGSTWAWTGTRFGILSGSELRIVDASGASRFLLARSASDVAGFALENTHAAFAWARPDGRTHIAVHRLPRPTPAER